MTRILLQSLAMMMACIGVSMGQTVGLQTHQTGTDAGYTMISRNGNAYLLDTAGQVLHTWNHGSNTKHPGYLQDNGDWILVRRGIKRYNWDGDIVWEYSNSEAHHDVAVMPNGHVLLLIWGFKTQAEAIAAGRNPAMLDGDLKPMMLHEINPNGEVVWEWHVWDHLIQDFDPLQDNFGVVEDHPELVDINYMRNSGDDWLHGNAIDYNPELDQIMLLPRFINEIWIIDHSTTSAEAAGHTGGNAGKGGDILYRWGNPEAYGKSGPQLNFGGHDAQWIKPGLPGAGNIIFFNNGGDDYGQIGNYSTVDEFAPPLNGFNYDMMPNGIYGPSTLVWQYQQTPPENFFSSFISGAHRLPNGNTFIDEGDKGLVIEVTSQGEVVWQYQNPISNSGIVSQGDPVPAAPATSLFRATKYPADHPAFVGRNLIPQGGIENYPGLVELNIEFSHAGLVVYPAMPTMQVGIGQKIPLVADQDGQFAFVEWTVEAGSVMVADSLSRHTDVIMNAENATIRANFEVNPDWIFGHGFDD